MELIRKYFPDLSEKQYQQFQQLEELTKDWNSKINVISRKDMDHLEERHILHALGIATVKTFADGSRILDVGTGGGYPGLPLAILYPKCHFTLVDSIGKKIKVVKDCAEKLGLENVEAYHKRAEEIDGTFDFVVSRAVTRLLKFYPWVKKKIKKGKDTAGNDRGILALKGGDLEEEVMEFEERFVDCAVLSYDLFRKFKEPFFETKKVLYIFKG